MMNSETYSSLWLPEHKIYEEKIIPVPGKGAGPRGPCLPCSGPEASVWLSGGPENAVDLRALAALVN